LLKLFPDGEDGEGGEDSEDSTVRELIGQSQAT
jgi:hypothetical protein